MHAAVRGRAVSIGRNQLRSQIRSRNTKIYLWFANEEAETDRPVEALGGAGGDEAVGVGEPREDAHLARVLKLDACTRTRRSELLYCLSSHQQGRAGRGVRKIKRRRSLLTGRHCRRWMGFLFSRRRVGFSGEDGRTDARAKGGAGFLG